MANRRLYRRTKAGTAAWQRQDASVPLEYRRVLGMIDGDMHPDSLRGRLPFTEIGLHRAARGAGRGGLPGSGRCRRDHDLDFTGNLNLSRPAESGSDTVKVEPLPGVLSSRIAPPCSSTKRLVSASPRPGALGLAHVVAARPAGTPRTPLPGPPARCRCRCRAPRPRPRRSPAWRDDVDLAAVGRELHRVRQQVEHDLLELALVRLELAQRSDRPPAPSAMPWRCARSRTSVMRVSSARRQVEASTAPAPCARPRSWTDRGCR